MHRRKFLSLTGQSIVGASLMSACKAPEDETFVPSEGVADARETPDTPAETEEPTDPTDVEDETTPPDAPEPDTTVDVGPDLPLTLPGSLTAADDQELSVTLSVVAGELPSDMSGHAFFIHAVPYQNAGSLFAGDGRIMRLDFSPSTVELTTRIARTPCWYADQATAGTQDGFRMAGGMARMSDALGTRNMANTAFLAMDDRIMIATDAGRPWEIDPSSLDMVTAVGSQQAWEPALPGFVSFLSGPQPFPTYMTTAHPARDPETGEMVTVNYGMSILGLGAFTRVMVWDGESEPRYWRVQNMWGMNLGIEQSVHQIGLTRNWIILADTAFVVEMSDVFGIDGFQPVSPRTKLYLIDRRRLTNRTDSVRYTTVTIEREVVHFLADFEDYGDVLVMHVAHNTAGDPSEFLEPGDRRADNRQAVRADLLGMPTAATDRGVLARYEIDAARGRVLTGELLHDEAFWGGPALVTWKGPDVPMEFGHVFWASLGFSPELYLDRIEEAYADHPYRHVAIEDLPTDPTPATLTSVDCRTLTLQETYSFPAGRVGFSPVFVPRVNSSHDRDGYIVCSVISDDTSTPNSTGDEFWIFDAARLADGPVARLAHPDLVMPLTLHTLWTPTAEPRTSAYRVDVREDVGEAVETLSASLQTMFEDEVYPHFTA